jgi:hypothetical protein
MTSKPDPAPTNFVFVGPAAMICAKSIFDPSTKKELKGVRFISIFKVGLTSTA